MISRVGGEKLDQMGGRCAYTDLARFFSKAGLSRPSEALVKEMTHRSLIQVWSRSKPLSKEIKLVGLLP